MSVQGSDDDVQRIAARTTLEGRTMTSEVRPARLRASVDRRDRVRWGPVWAGAVVAVAAYLLLELALLAVDALDADAGSELPDGAFLTVAAAALAFLVGGVVAGASFAHRDAGDGLLHGVLVWATGILTFLVVAVLNAGLAFGTLGYTADRAGSGGGGEETTAVQEDDLEEAAGATALMLGATAAAAAVGGVVGSKLWPRADRRDDPGPHDREDAWRSTGPTSEGT